MHGIRARLTVTLVALVAVTAALLGVGAYLFVENSLRQQVVADAAAQARFDLAVLAPSRLTTPDPKADDAAVRQLLQAFQLRGVETIVDFGDGDPANSRLELAGVLPTLPADLTQRVANGELAYAWMTVGGQPSLVVGGRMGQSGPVFYFVHDVTALDLALQQLRLALIVGALALIVVALLVARVIARGVLAPVEAASRAAERIERGDLTARVPVNSSDEFGTWAEQFNRMAEALAETIGRLETAEAQNRRFVADVAHELRTPLAALVAEASILRDHLGALPPESRRAGELLVADVGRLRTLVDELMEISRFDAGAEQIALEPVDVGRLVAALAATRAPEASLDLPADPVVIESDPRRLERILDNLLDNAREHAPGVAVEVSVAASSEGLVIAVADRGLGVPPDQLERIFDRFYKADPSRHGGSSGLGLAIAAEHAALLGGRLVASDRLGGGLRVELRLPVTGSLRPGDTPAIDGIHGAGLTSTPSEPTP